MIEPNALYHVEGDSERAPQHAPLLLVGLEGFLDAGQVREQLMDHLLQTLEHTVVATFDTDELIDYRGRRPLMTFDRDQWTGYDDPHLVLYRMIDRTGQPFLMLHGVEPDYRWESFCAAIRQLALGFGVRTMVSAHGIPMAVPHTRPVGTTLFSSDPDRLDAHEPLFGQVKVPGSADSLLHLRLAEAGLTTMGVAVHVPHYLAETPFTDAALTALEALVRFTGLDLPSAELMALADSNRAEIGAEISNSTDAAEVVAALEQRYDSFMEGQRRRSLLAAQVAELPSAEEIGAEFEEFLRESSEQARSPERAEDDDSGEGTSGDRAQE